MKRGAIERRLRHLAKKQRRRTPMRSSLPLTSPSYFSGWAPSLCLDTFSPSLSNVLASGVVMGSVSLAWEPDSVRTWSFTTAEPVTISPIQTYTLRVSAGGRVESVTVTFTEEPDAPSPEALPPAEPPFRTMGEWRGYMRQEYEREVQDVLYRAGLAVADPSPERGVIDALAEVKDDTWEHTYRLREYQHFLDRWKTNGCYDGGTELVYVNRERHGA